MLPLGHDTGMQGAEAEPQQPPTKKQRKKAARAVLSSALAREPVYVVEVPGGAFAVILDLLLTSPLSATFLRHSLSSLSSAHAHKLLFYLYAWTLRYWLHTDKELHKAIQSLQQRDGRGASVGRRPSLPSASALATGVAQTGPFRVPTLSQLVDWMNILLDAVDFIHVHNKEEHQAEKRRQAQQENGDAPATSSASDPLSLRTLLQSLASHVSHHHLRLVEESQDLKGFLSLFTLLARAPNAAPLPQQPVLDYAVELLELSA